MDLDFSHYNKEKNTIKAETFKSDDESRFVAYLCLIKNEDVDLAADVFCLLAKGSKPDCQSWMKKILGYLPRARDYSVSELTEIALVSMVLTDYGIGNLNELYINGQLKHYKNIPLNSLHIRSTGQQKSYKDQSRSTQKTGKDVAHLGGLDLITQLNMELAPRFRVDIDFLRDFLNRFNNFRVVKASTNRSLHKRVDNLLLSGDCSESIPREVLDRITQIVGFFQRDESQTEMLATGGTRRLYAKVRDRVRAINPSLWDIRRDRMDLRY